MDFHFYNQCAKCNKTSKLDILKWAIDFVTFNTGKEVVTECSGIVYFSLYCNRCNQCLAGMFEYGLDVGHPHPLNEYDQGSGNISDFINNFYEDFIFDVKPCKRNNLFSQAEVCYACGAFSAVIMLCRTIIDTDTKKMWDASMKDADMPGKLKPRLQALFPTDNDRSNNTKNYHITNILRFLGNEVTHEETLVTKEKAKQCLELTEQFINGSNENCTYNFFNP
ncbi:hypothetical protein HX52_05585 [Salmonella enterica]|uniref:DUF4145 domain-containing protein n=2 Tax=Enterobacterales TaxID=91347 RepID=A0A5V0FCW4_SALAB|nr:hypothetical protein [Salmonella enterica]EBS6067784.1 hypothetical protein [Salmonella enterica subsp. enterica serovar Abony]EDU6129904.1 hypothetical protein [Salmonella enterica subsp. enterica]EAW8181734.1 hypothetical protein [Salmonella enterica]EBH5154313.1 hypothetical protein [Salmonella enterica]